MIQYLPWVLIVIGLLTLLVMAVRGEVPGFFGRREREWYSQIIEDDLQSFAHDIQPRPSRNNPTFWVTAIITILVLISALFIILAPGMYGDTEQKWASGAVGTILGFWLRRT